MSIKFKTTREMILPESHVNATGSSGAIHQIGGFTGAPVLEFFSIN